MKSIKEYNTIGMGYFDRVQLIKEVELIPIGETVFDAGGFADPVSKIVVDEKNQKRISMFWNSMYFDNEKDANLRNAYLHRDYIWSMDSCMP